MLPGSAVATGAPVTPLGSALNNAAPAAGPTGPSPSLGTATVTAPLAIAFLPRASEWDRAVGLGLLNFCNSLNEGFDKCVHALNDAYTAFSDFRDVNNPALDSWLHGCIEAWGGVAWPMRFKDDPAILVDAVKNFYDSFNATPDRKTIWILPLPQNQRAFSGALSTLSDKKYNIHLLCIEDIPKGVGPSSVWTLARQSRAAFSLLNPWVVERFICPVDGTLRVWVNPHLPEDRPPDLANGKRPFSPIPKSVLIVRIQTRAPDRTRNRAIPQSEFLLRTSEGPPRSIDLRTYGRSKALRFDMPDELLSGFRDHGRQHPIIGNNRSLVAYPSPGSTKLAPRSYIDIYVDDSFDVSQFQTHFVTFFPRALLFWYPPPDNSSWLVDRVDFADLSVAQDIFNFIGGSVQLITARSALVIGSPVDHDDSFLDRMRNFTTEGAAPLLRYAALENGVFSEKVGRPNVGRNSQSTWVSLTGFSGNHENSELVFFLQSTLRIDHSEIGGIFRQLRDDEEGFSNNVLIQLNTIPITDVLCDAFPRGLLQQVTLRSSEQIFPTVNRIPADTLPKDNQHCVYTGTQGFLPILFGTANRARQRAAAAAAAGVFGGGGALPASGPQIASQPVVLPAVASSGVGGASPSAPDSATPPSGASRSLQGLPPPTPAAAVVGAAGDVTMGGSTAGGFAPRGISRTAVQAGLDSQAEATARAARVAVPSSHPSSEGGGNDGAGAAIGQKQDSEVTDLTGDDLPLSNLLPPGHQFLLPAPAGSRVPSPGPGSLAPLRPPASFGAQTGSADLFASALASGQVQRSPVQQGAYAPQFGTGGVQMRPHGSGPPPLPTPSVGQGCGHGGCPYAAGQARFPPAPPPPPAPPGQGTVPPMGSGVYCLTCGPSGSLSTFCQRGLYTCLYCDHQVCPRHAWAAPDGSYRYYEFACLCCVERGMIRMDGYRFPNLAFENGDIGEEQRDTELYEDLQRVCERDVNLPPWGGDTRRY